MPDPVHQHPTDPSLPAGTSLEGLAQSRGHLTSPKHAEDRPVHARDLEIFKAGMTSVLMDMLQSSFSNFASQLKSSSGGQGESESTQNVTSDQEKEPSDHADHSKGGDLASVEDPTENPSDPKLENLMMTEEEERDFDNFALASPNVTKRKTSWRAFQENIKFYSQAQQIHHDSFTSQARPVDSQALARDQVDQV